MHKIMLATKKTLFTFLFIMIFASYEHSVTNTERVSIKCWY